MLSCSSVGCTASTEPSETQDPLGAPLFESGARLRAEFWVTPDGAESFAGFFDAELGVRCVVRRSTDGELRCSPRDVLQTTAFADSDCTIPVALLDQGPQGAQHLMSGDAGQVCTFDEAVTIFQRGAEGEGQLFGRDGARCEPIPWLPAARYVEAGPELLPDRFVPVDDVQRVGSGRIVREVRRAGDGALMTVGAFDQVRGVGTAVSGLVDVPPHWMDRDYASHDGFVAADCSTPVVRSYSGCADSRPRLEFEAPPIFICARISRMFQVGEPVAAPFRSGSCAAEPTDGQYYQRGAELTLDAFEPVRFVPRSYGRLEEARPAGASGDGVLAGTWTDNTLGVGCSLEPDPADPTRGACVPARGRIGFADPACTAPAVAISSCQSDPRYVTDDQGRVFSVAERLEDGPLYERRDGDCVFASTSATPLRALGRELSRSELARAELRRD